VASLTKLLSADDVIEVDRADRDGVLAALVEVAAPRLALEGERLLTAILEREALHSTGFGGGLAMPHVRLKEARDFALVLARCPGVEFGAVDGEPVRLLFLVVGPMEEKGRYQKIMARAAKFLKAEAEGLLAAEDFQAVAVAAVLDH
jgi:mannitol/fructose-specific phosphotransferase system IIA component (Ntr-type)